MGIEPTSSAWKAEVLPLNYTRLYLHHPFQPKFNRKTQLIFYFTYLYKVAKYFLSINTEWNIKFFHIEEPFDQIIALIQQ